MSSQEPTVTEETTAAGVEEQPQPDTSESSSGLAEPEAVSESSLPTAPSATQPEAAAEATPSEESKPSTEIEAAGSESISIHTLKAGQHLVGKVKNITGFGAFIDIGLPQDGLVHISKLSRRKVEKVTDVVSEGQEIDVWVKKVDKKRGRISLTMIKPIKLKLKKIKEGAELEGTITRLESYGAFVDIGSDRDGLVHISQVTHDYVKHPEETLAVGDKVKIKVLKVNRKKRQVDLSIKALLTPPPVEKAEAKEKVEATEKVGEVVEDESMPTAMAVAYAAFQNWNQSDEQSSGKGMETAEEKSKEKQEMDAIVARTLATRQD